MVWCRGLPAAVAALLALRLEAVRAIDRLVVPRNERDHRLLAARAAGRRVHGALLATAAIPAAVSVRGAATRRIAASLVRAPAIWAASGLIGEALLGVEFLLARGEDEIFAAVTAGQGLICETHLVEFSYVPLHRHGGSRKVCLGSGFLGKMSSETGPLCRTGHALGNLWPLSVELTPIRAIMLVLAPARFCCPGMAFSMILASGHLRGPPTLWRIRGDFGTQQLRGLAAVSGHWFR